jgi:DNA-binding transcriptional ArsR family regulator
MTELDRVIHEPARLSIVTILATVIEADFLFLLQATELTKGNLSTHLVKLEERGYVEIEKAFRGKIPLTLARLTPEGRGALQSYRKGMTALLKVRKRRASAVTRSLGRGTWTSHEA